VPAIYCAVAGACDPAPGAATPAVLGAAGTLVTGATTVGALAGGGAWGA
jgi:hypothetical protein